MVEGDIAFNSTTKSLYAYDSSSWVKVSQVLAAGNSTITINEANGTISVGTLSANNFDNDAVGNSIELVGGRISLSATQIKTDQINTNTATHLKLPKSLILMLFSIIFLLVELLIMHS